MDNLLEPTDTKSTEDKTVEAQKARAENDHATVSDAQVSDPTHYTDTGSVSPERVVTAAQATGRSRNSALALLLGIIGLSGAFGFLLSELLRSQSDASLLATRVATMGFVNQQGSASVADAQAAATVKESVVTDQIGELRAELLRLHVLYIRLAEMAELDEGEFDLESPLLEWKEQSSLQKLGLLNRRVAHMSDMSGVMESIFAVRRIAFDQKLSGKPIVDGHRTSGFGFRTDPITGARVEHLGLDFSGPVGEPILALADGVVSFSGKNSGYGNMVELEHTGGLKTRYAHNQANLVKRGERVSKGEPIATLGSTGRSTGPHVHVEVRLDGSPIDPGFFIR